MKRSRWSWWSLVGSALLVVLAGCGKDEARIAASNLELQKTLAQPRAVADAEINAGLRLLESCAALHAIDPAAYSETCRDNETVAFARAVLEEKRASLSPENRQILDASAPPTTNAPSPRPPNSQPGSAPLAIQGEASKLVQEIRTDIDRLSREFAHAAVRGQFERYTDLVAQLEVRQETLRRSMGAQTASLGPDALELLPNETLQSILTDMKRVRRLIAKSAVLASTPSRELTLTELDKEILRLGAVIEKDETRRFRLARSELPDGFDEKQWDRELANENDRLTRARERQSRIAAARFPAVYSPQEQVAATTPDPRYPRSERISRMLYAYNADPLTWIETEASLKAELRAADRGAIGQEGEYRRRLARELSDRDLAIQIAMTKRAAAQFGDPIPGSVKTADARYFNDVHAVLRAEHYRRSAAPGDFAPLPSPQNLRKSEAVERAALIRLAETRYGLEPGNMPTAIADRVREIKTALFDQSLQRATRLMAERQRMSDAIVMASVAVSAEDLRAIEEVMSKTKTAVVRLDELRRDPSMAGWVAPERANDVEVWLQVCGLTPRPPPAPEGPAPAPITPKPPTPRGAPGALASSDAVLESRFLDAETATADVKPVVDRLLGSIAESNAQQQADLGPERRASRNDVVRIARRELAFTSIPKGSKPRDVATGRIDPATEQPFDYRSVMRPRRFAPVGGGIHYGLVAAKTGDSSQPKTIRYDLRTRRLVVTSRGSTYRSEPIDPAVLKALYRYAQSKQNLAVSIGWSGDGDDRFSDRSGEQDVLLDPPFIDTRVGQDLILSDQIPWEFDKPLPNGAKNPVAAEFAAAERARAADEKAGFDGLVSLIESKLTDVQPLSESDVFDWPMSLVSADPLSEDPLVIAAQAIYGNDSRDRAWSEAATKLSRKSDVDEVNAWLGSLKPGSAQARGVDDAFRMVNAAFGENGDKEGGLDRAALVAASRGRLPIVLLRLGWADKLSNLGPYKTGDSRRSYARTIAAVLPRTTLAVLLDDSATFSLAGEQLVLGGRMKYMYLTQYKTMDAKEIRASKPDDPKQEVRHLVQHEAVVNEGYDALVRAYPPLQRVTEYARIVSFLRWLRDNRADVLTDFSELASVSASDSRRTPTIDVLMR